MEIWESLGRPPMFLLDLRPVSYRILIVTSHEVAEQISRSSKLFPWSVTKSPTIRDQQQVFGHQSMLALQGEEWKTLRRKFNPGFAHQHLMTLLPVIMDKTWEFMKNLDSFAKTGEDFALGQVLTNLTFDIIGIVTMDVDFGAQRDKAHQSEFIKVYQQLLALFEEDENPLPQPVRGARRWWVARKMDKLLTEMVKRKLTEYRQLGVGNKSRSIVSLASRDSEAITPDLVQLIVDQVKTFVFAGHDTTSILIQWTFYELSRNPRARKAVLSELDEIFGPDPDPAIVRDKLLSDGDEVMRRMVYSSAVIKEILRLYPPAGSARMSMPGKGFKLRMPNDNREVGVDGMVAYNCHTIIQRDPAVYGETANDFVPERWLGCSDTSTDTNDEVVSGEKSGNQPPATAWRPFERGPRNCIGQDLANIEARVILACAARRYDFTKVGLGELALDANGNPRLNAKGEYEVKSKMYNVSGGKTGMIC
jgi:cytochrome P450